jgi:hypothetical protein
VAGALTSAIDASGVAALAALVALAFAWLATRAQGTRVTSGALGVALGIVSALAMRAIDPLLPAIAAIALALPAGALIAFLSRKLL